MSLQERTSRTLMWFGHYYVPIVLLALGSSIVADVLPRYQTQAGIATFAIWPFFMIALVSSIGLHERRLCERCISAAPVLDPGKAVRRWRPLLWFFHRTAAVIILMLAAIIWFFATAFLKHPPLWARVSDIIATCVLSCCILALHQHSKLMPWCPWCRWGGGGGQDVTSGMPETPASR